MVNVTAQIYPPSAQEKTRKVFAFGWVKVKLNAGKPEHDDELKVLGMLVVEDQEKSDREGSLEETWPTLKK